jgi:hypothetical protein
VTCGTCGDDCAPTRCSWLHTCQWCARDIGDYEPTARDAKLVSAERHCEECHMEVVRVAKRERRAA